MKKETGEKALQSLNIVFFASIDYMYVDYVKDISL